MAEKNYTFKLNSQTAKIIAERDLKISEAENALDKANKTCDELSLQVENLNSKVSDLEKACQEATVEKEKLEKALEDIVAEKDLLERSGSLSWTRKMLRLPTLLPKTKRPRLK